MDLSSFSGSLAEESILFIQAFHKYCFITGTNHSFLLDVFRDRFNNKFCSIIHDKIIS